ncbi:LOG family protein [Croceicoccus mobilis]|uniref:Cytokinin riboside 5'-monophosphate phosphoribohydrolase n=1 Tax=Croceicoccus mobilis TaxID=1703339 RepID=A0A916YZW7_9SPHN|nr:TIGR00730 family Rossman fold protein [Croceicoccus mobilis]GGD69274.1 cytokinin riboside 5'-monophosphate phosphoribohydrolase [Croceicoccus mobilis]
MAELKSLAVYCGSGMGQNPVYAAATVELGKAMAKRGIDLVYGGGKLGLMGIIADTVLEAGGKAYGVIPDALSAHEVAHLGLTELHQVAGMHERKAKMTQLADAFVCLPGGIGTLDELMEAWTWNALGYHAKPFCLLDIHGYWQGFAQFCDTVQAEGFMSVDRRRQLLVAPDVESSLDMLAEAVSGAVNQPVW